MKNSLIRTINSEMNLYLNNFQLEKLNEILEYNFYNYDVIEIGSIVIIKEFKGNIAIVDKVK